LKTSFNYEVFFFVLNSKEKHNSKEKNSTK